jgi:Spy/CpxP family protein refolding chaperone
MIRRSVVLLAMLAVAGTALAQEPPAPPPPPWHGHHQWKNAAEWRQKMEQRRMEQLAVLLDLTPAQRQQVQAILSEQRAKMKTAMQQVEQAMSQARAAHEAAHKETLQRLSSVLTPVQMKKLDVLMPQHGMWPGMMMHRMMMHRMMMHGMDHDMGDDMEGAPPPPPH